MRIWRTMACGMVVAVVVGLAGAAGAEGPATRPKSLFDPARHMRVDEVRDGMTGYGLSVFKGTKIERFNVKVISVLKSPFAPKCDVVLIECGGMNLEQSGIAQGMSGSPIFLNTREGPSKMIGALAYGWPMMKDPIAGVQPIEYMLEIVDGPMLRGAGGTKAAVTAVEGGAPAPAGRVRWTLDDCRAALAPRKAEAAGARVGFDGRAVRLGPLSSPMMVAGVPERVLRNYVGVFGGWGMTPMAGAGGGKAAGAADSLRIEPGSVMAVPMITGDIESAVIGTCTEVVGDRAFGFGHPFTNEGPIALPLATGSINAIIPNLQTSFKIGAMVKMTGTLTADQNVGAAGRIGATPPAMIPVEIAVKYADGSLDQTYRLNIVSHPKMTAGAAAMAMQAAVSGSKELPQYHTLDYDLKLEFANGQSVRIDNTMVNAHGMEMYFELGLPIAAAADNPFERVMLKRMTGSVNVASESRLARIQSVNLAKAQYQPGETAKLFVTYRPFRGEEAIVPVDFEIPRDLADGTYNLYVTDWDGHLEQEKMAQPFRFTAESTGEVFAVLKDILAVKKAALYVRLMRQADGVAVGRTAMPRLPSSRRQILLGAGQSDTTAFVSSTVKSVPMKFVMDGAATFAITVSRQDKLDGGGAGKAVTTPKDAKPATPTPAPSDTKPKTPNKSDPAKPETKPDTKPDAKPDTAPSSEPAAD